eukprot:475731-Pleurochrysis_carterae.AAC.3
MGMRLARVVTPVHVVFRDIADGDAGCALDVVVTCEPIAMCTPDEVTKLVRVEFRARPCSRECDFRVVQHVAAVCKQCFAKVEGRKLLYPAKREQGVSVIVGGPRSKRLALRRTVVNLLVVDIDCFQPRRKVTDRRIGPNVGKRDESRLIRGRETGEGRTHSLAFRRGEAAIAVIGMVMCEMDSAVVGGRKVLAAVRRQGVL